MDLKFYICRHCGNIIDKIKDSGVPVVCCGEDMERIEASEEANVKHTPVISSEGGTLKIKVGEAVHPMAEEHFINFIYLETDKRVLCCRLSPNMEPEASFLLLDGEKPVAAYEYCNIHGLWKKNI